MAGVSLNINRNIPNSAPTIPLEDTPSLSCSVRCEPGKGREPPKFNMSCPAINAMGRCLNPMKFIAEHWVPNSPSRKPSRQHRRNALNGPELSNGRGLDVPSLPPAGMAVPRDTPTEDSANYRLDESNTCSLFTPLHTPCCDAAGAEPMDLDPRQTDASARTVSHQDRATVPTPNEAGDRTEPWNVELDKEFGNPDLLSRPNIPHGVQRYGDSKASTDTPTLADAPERSKPALTTVQPPLVAMCIKQSLDGLLAPSDLRPRLDQYPGHANAPMNAMAMHARPDRDSMRPLLRSETTHASTVSEAAERRRNSRNSRDATGRHTVPRQGLLIIASGDVEVRRIFAQML
uniref:NS38 n=1 Tax=Grass carp reovirus TaxID=128987 RepID=A0A5J6Y2Y4_GCRV|nr:NS38 [Grass carp reovirus]